MSFDIFLAHYERGEAREAPRAPVLEVLNARSHSPAGGPGAYLVDSGDGTSDELTAGGLETEKPFKSCAFHVRTCTRGVVRLIYEVAIAGQMVILPAMEGNPVIFVADAIRDHVPKEMLEGPSAITVASVEDLETVLSEGLAGWKAYRDRVVGPH